MSKYSSAVIDKYSPEAFAPIPKYADGKPRKIPAFNEEWRLLKRAWTLADKGKEIQAKRLLSNANKNIYFDEQLDDVDDWIFRFLMRCIGPVYTGKVSDILKDIGRILSGQPRGRSAFLKHFKEDLYSKRKQKMHGLLASFFDKYGEFEQVAHYCSADVEYDREALISSTDFGQTKNYYGNVFELVTEFVQTFAMLNNVDRLFPFQ